MKPAKDKRREAAQRMVRARWEDSRAYREINAPETAKAQAKVANRRKRRGLPHARESWEAWRTNAAADLLEA